MTRSIDDLSELEECIIEGCERAVAEGRRILADTSPGLSPCALGIQFPGVSWRAGASLMGLSRGEMESFALGFDGRARSEFPLRTCPTFYAMGHRIADRVREMQGGVL